MFTEEPLSYQIWTTSGLPMPLSRTTSPVFSPYWHRVLVGVVLCFALAAPCRAQVFYSVISSDGRQSWLLGTIHAEDERALEFPPVLQQALRQADRIALELLPRQAAMKRLAAAMQLPEEQRLADYLDDELYESVLAAMRDHGIEPDAVARMRPWAAALTLAQPPVRTGRFMDLALAQRAAEHGAVAMALETMDEQLAFFTEMGPDAHVALLESAVADHARGRQAFESLIKAYLDGDLEQLVELAEAELSGLPAEIREHFREAGILQRNRNMARRAQPLIEQGRTLIAVGALHLPGPEGLVALLRGQGNQVEAIY